MSSPPLRVFLNTEEERTLWELRRGKNIPQRTKDRAQAVRLSAQGWRVEKISHYLKCSPSTVCSTLHRWKEKGLAGLWDAPRSGRNKKWQISDITAVEEKLETEQRTYNSKQLRQFLVTERQISLSERQLRRILKKKTNCGKEHGLLINRSKISLKKKLVKLT
jgi:transposase